MINKHIIYAKDLSLERSGRNIFCSLNFSLDSSESIIIKGKNGSGKTSLLRCIANFIQLLVENYYGMESLFFLHIIPKNLWYLG